MDYELSMSDIISALSDNIIVVPVGHESSYWRNESNVIREIFANISSIDILGYNSKDEAILKDIFAAYVEMVE